MKMSIAAVAAAMTIIGGAAQAATVYATNVYIDAGANQNTADSLRFGPDNALGAPDGDFYSLGFGGAALFTFGSDILGPGMIFEVTFNCAGASSFCDGYPESAEIYGVNGPIDLTGLENGFVGGVQNYDLSSLSLTFIDAVPNGSAQSGFSFDTGGNTFSGLFIRDTSTMQADGFDVAAISATPAPVPLPPAVAMLGAALGGLGLMRRRRTA